MIRRIRSAGHSATGWPACLSRRGLGTPSAATLTFGGQDSRARGQRLANKRGNCNADEPNGGHQSRVRNVPRWCAHEEWVLRGTEHQQTPVRRECKKLWTGGNSVFCGRVVVAFSPMTAQPVLWALEGSFITRVRWRAARHSAVLTAFSDGILKRSAMS